MRTIVYYLISLYKYVTTPVLVQIFGNACRYNPTCADYSRQAVMKHGVVKGLVLAVRRIGKCHPFAKNQTAFDPVPDGIIK